MMDLFVKYMSIGINNIINTFNIDLIVLNSSFSNYIPDINQRIVAYLAIKTGTAALSPPGFRIRPGLWEEYASALRAFSTSNI